MAAKWWKQHLLTWVSHRCTEELMGITKAATGPLWPQVVFIAWIGTVHACADDQIHSSSALDEAVRSIREIRGVHALSYAHSRHPSKGCVIQLLDMHYISWDQYLGWVKTHDTDIVARGRGGLRAQYQSDMHEIEALQLEHESIIRDITTRFGMAVVYVEGLVADDPVTNEFLMAVRGGERHLHEVARTVPRVNDFLKKFEAAKPSGLSSTDWFKLSRGAPASLFLSGKLNTIEPVERSTALYTYRWGLGGRLLYSKDADEAREDAIASTLLKGQMPVLIVLGGGHDLNDNLQRLSAGTCDYLRVKSDAYYALYGKIWKRNWFKARRPTERKNEP